MDQTYASKVVLEPIDTTQLRSLGLRITGEQIQQTRDEKKELLKRPISAGEHISIDYLINGEEKVSVIFRALKVDPPTTCYVGENTLVVIMGENNEENQKPDNKAILTDLLREDLSFLQGEIKLCNLYNLDPRNLLLEEQRINSYLTSP